MAGNNRPGSDCLVTATQQDGGVIPGMVSVLDAWISDPNAELARFFAEDVPALAGLPDPWTIDGLGLTAQAGWHAFSSAPVLLCEPDSQQRLDRYLRYVGELYRRTLHGRWHTGRALVVPRRLFGLRWWVRVPVWHVGNSPIPVSL